MAELDVITSMLDDLFAGQSISTALGIGRQLTQNPQAASHLAVQWDYFNVNDILNLPFTQRYDFALLDLTGPDMAMLEQALILQVLVKLRDLLARHIVIIGQRSHEQLLRSLGFTQLLQEIVPDSPIRLWQFNILAYKDVPDWLNSKYWANPQNWDKYRW